VLASFVGIITPTLIMGGALGLQSEMPYLISMALFVSGLGTFVQARVSARSVPGCCACKAPVFRLSA
jgi:xanthine/uracil permease